uniref:Uncharacterized protein n=1 Tax=Lepeophtheirus salmonis TaxID=72036 RepID=A0A0K2TE37_LEPSM
MINQTKFPASAMLGIMASDEKRMPSYWFPKGLKIGAKECQDVLKEVVLSCVKSKDPEEIMCSSRILFRGTRPGRRSNGLRRIYPIYGLPSRPT